MGQGISLGKSTIGQGLLYLYNICSHVEFDSQKYMIYPLVMTDIAMEHGHRNNEFTLKMVLVHSYVSLLEGIQYHI